MNRVIALWIVVAMFAGCSQKSADAPSTAANLGTLASFNPGHAPTIAFSVPDMMCAEGCGAKTKQILSKQPGAKDVFVDFDTKTATVAIDEGTFDVKLAIAELVDHGFEHSQLKTALASRATERNKVDGDLLPSSAASETAR